MNREVLIARVSHVEARCEPMEWRWAQENRDRIEENWRRRTADKPRMFNGRVLVMRDMDLSADTCRMIYSEVDFKDFLGWIDLGNPDSSITNAFSAGALQGSDGAFICGVMAAHTANAGRIYFAAGTPDLSDVRPDGSVDLASSQTREIHEETGLTGEDYAVHDGWIIVRCWPSVALIRYVVANDTAEQVAEKIRVNIAAQPDPELEDVRVIRGLDDLSPRAMPPYVQHFARWHFSQR